MKIKSFFFFLDKMKMKSQHTEIGVSKSKIGAACN